MIDGLQKSEASLLKLRVVIWMIACVLLALESSKAADKMQVEVVETSSTIRIGQSLLITAFAKVILPDGSHARLMCLASDGHCANIAPIAPEKMPVDSRTCSTFGKETTCVTSNLGRYEAERKGNELAIRAPNGKLKFRIVGSW